MVLNCFVYLNVLVFLRVAKFPAVQREYWFVKPMFTNSPSPRQKRKNGCGCSKFSQYWFFFLVNYTHHSCLNHRKLGEMRRGQYFCRGWGGGGGWGLRRSTIFNDHTCLWISPVNTLTISLLICRFLAVPSGLFNYHVLLKLRLQWKLLIDIWP